MKGILVMHSWAIPCDCIWEVLLGNIKKIILIELHPRKWLTASSGKVAQGNFMKGVLVVHYE